MTEKSEDIKTVKIDVAAVNAKVRKSGAISPEEADAAIENARKNGALAPAASQTQSAAAQVPAAAPATAATPSLQSTQPAQPPQAAVITRGRVAS